ncbi:MAG: hypothetical protein AAF211_11280 [Myxococcota bacterium]
MATDLELTSPMDWETVRRQWARVRDAWSARWRKLQEFGLRQFGAAIRREPAAQLDRVRRFWVLLDESRQTLDLLQRLVVEVPKWKGSVDALEERYRVLAAGLFAEAQPAPAGASVGAGPLVGVVIAGVVIGVAGIAWAIAAYQEALSLRDQTRFLQEELVARLQIAREGGRLPPSVLQPAPTTDRASPSSVGWWLLGGLALGTAALTIPVLLPRRRSA